MADSWEILFYIEFKVFFKFVNNMQHNNEAGAAVVAGPL